LWSVAVRWGPVVVSCGPVVVSFGPLWSVVVISHTAAGDCHFDLWTFRHFDSSP